MSAVTVTVRQDRTDLVVTSPYDALYVAAVKLLRGRWEPESRSWRVPLHQRDALRELLLRVYRVDGGLPAPSAPPAAVPRTPRELAAAALAAMPLVEQMIVPAGGAGA